tara:strand:- start:1987 stop:3150 length:1164 start_codon:yes stop_codon:yes gene_type:complete
MRKSKSKTKNGKLNAAEIRNLLNKQAGADVSYDLLGDNPTEVKEWIPTGSRWLDSIICRGRLAGIPVGKITEIAGLESTGKSFLAAQVAANAQSMGIDVIYFDSESAIDPVFLERTGCDLSSDVGEGRGSFVYIQPESVEHVLETIETLLDANDNKMLFIWDSLALTPSATEVESDFNPTSSVAVTARILSKGMKKLTRPIASKNATFLVLNQLKTNITQNRIEAMVSPYVTPGGKTMNYVASLRVWLTSRKSKSAFLYDDKGFVIGSEVKAKLKKSRFGTQMRECVFKILWGDEIGVQDKESWFEAIKGSDAMVSRGAWYYLDMGDGKEEKFQQSKWLDKLEDSRFYNRVVEIMDQEIILKFNDRSGDASDYYDIDGEQELENAAL